MPALVDDLQNAAEFHRTGRLDEAEQIYRRLLSEEPDNAAALNLLGVLCAQTERMDEGRRHLEYAVRLSPDQAAIRFNLANVLRSAGLVRNAIDHYRAALRLAPDHIPARLNLAAAYIDAGRPKQAIACYREILERDALNADAHHSLARVQWDAGDAAGAQKTLDEWLATAEGARDVEAMTLRAFMHFQQECFDDALALWSSCSEVQPDEPEHHHNQGQALVALDRTQEAAGAFAQSHRLAPENDRFLLRLLEALDKLGDDGGIAAACNAAIERDPESWRARLSVADALREIGRMDDAIETYRKAVELLERPDSVPAESDVSGGAASARTYLFAALCNLAGTLNHAGRSSEAVAAARRALEIERDSIDAHINLATASLNVGDLETALAHGRRAVEIDATSVAARSTFAAALHQAGRIEDAIAQLTDLTVICPQDEDAWTQLGHFHRETGNLDAAGQAYETAGRCSDEKSDAHG